MTVVSVDRYDYQTLDFDMMMIKLYHPVVVTPSVAPISLPTSLPQGGMPCSVSGWGNIAPGGEGELTTPSFNRTGDGNHDYRVCHPVINCFSISHTISVSPQRGRNVCFFVYGLESVS